MKAVIPFSSHNKIPVENRLGKKALVWLGVGGDRLVGSGRHGSRSLLTSTWGGSGSREQVGNKARI